MAWEIINKQVAEQYLTHNTGNYRRINQALVDSYALDMAAGKWVANGEAIVFNKSGMLQNGQHRLSAIVKADAVVKCYVIHDADDTDFYDLSGTRTLGQIACARHIGANYLTTAIAKLCVCGFSSFKSSKGLIIDYVESHLEDLQLAESIISTGGGTSNTCKKAAVGVMVYAALRADKRSEDALRTFCRVINTGNTVDCDREASPALVCKRQLDSYHGGGVNIQRLQFECSYKAYKDFQNNVPRRKNYPVDTDYCDRIIETLHKIDKI